jgi:tRNA-Thr(GGU) m(6)t(6)A37 methyltransferase TsaA
VTEKLPDINLKAIGTVRSEIKTRGWDDTKDTIAEIVLDPSLTEALDSLEDFSHIIVIYYLHKSHQPPPMKVHPRFRVDIKAVGVFASRSPDRPSPLGKATVKLLERRANILKVRGLDAINGTPVIDIKPYIPDIDAVAGARLPRWMKKI